MNEMHPGLAWVGTFLLGSAGGAAGAAVVNKMDAHKKETTALPPSPTKTSGADDLGADLTSIDGTTGTWVQATNADVQRDKVVHLYTGLLKKDVGKERLAKVGDHIWKLKVVSKDTDPDFTKREKDVRGWIWNCDQQKDDDDDDDKTSGGDDVGATYKLPFTKKDLVIEIRNRDDAQAPLPAASAATSTPTVTATVAAPTPPPKVAITVTPKSSVKGLEGIDDLGYVEFSGAVELDSTGNFSGLGDQIFAIGSKAAGATLNMFVPGAGVLADQLGTKVKAQVDKSTGHNPNSGTMPVSALPGFVAEGSYNPTSAPTGKPTGKVVIKAQIDNNGLQGDTKMSDAHERTLGTGETPSSVSGPGELPGKPSPLWYGAVRKGNGYWWPAPNRMGMITVNGKQQLRVAMMMSYKKALDSWTARNSIYQKQITTQYEPGRQKLLVGVPLQRQIASLQEQIALLQQGGDIDQDPDPSLFADNGYYSNLDDNYVDPNAGLYGTEAMDGADSMEGVELDDMGNVMTDSLNRANAIARQRQQQNPTSHRQPAHHDPRRRQSIHVNQHANDAHIIETLKHQLEAGKLDTAALANALHQAGHIVERGIHKAEREISLRRVTAGFSGTDDSGIRPPPAPTNMGYADEVDTTVHGDEAVNGDEGFAGTRPLLPPPAPSLDDMAGAAEGCGCPAQLN